MRNIACIKKGGETWLIAPIHRHGHSTFLRGDINKIFSLFEDEYWHSVEIEKWRENPKPLEKYRAFNNTIYPEDAFPSDATTFIVNIMAKKKDRQPNFVEDNIKYSINSVIKGFLSSLGLKIPYHHMGNVYRLYDSNVVATVRLIQILNTLYKREGRVEN